MIALMGLFLLVLVSTSVVTTARWEVAYQPGVGGSYVLLDRPASRLFTSDYDSAGVVAYDLTEGRITYRSGVSFEGPNGPYRGVP